MNQRISRNSKKNNNMDFSTFSTGGHVLQNTPNETPVVLVPQKATGDIKPEKLPGTAKASPNFKPIVPEKQLTEEEEKKAIANNSTKVNNKE